MIKKSIKKLTKKAGIEVRRINNAPPEVMFFDTMKEALLYSQGGKQAGFQCSFEKTTHHSALGFASKDWHPFVESARQLKDAFNTEYVDSILYRFYQTFQPKSASAAIAGFEDTPNEFQNLSPHLLFLSPWVSQNAAEVELDTRWWNEKDNVEHGAPHLNVDVDGWAYSGPVSNAKGELEFKRLKLLLKSLQENGYNLKYGGIGTTILKRGSEYRFLVGGGGYHRASALKALNYESFPATFHRNSIVDIDDASDWPNVKNGLWTESKAKAYVHHLFDFISKDWALNIGLPTQP
ncbi:hypothetical protein [Reinekea blandensis]|uniref:Uncharacterized protein n=1 Tax=Reinekea blandensis MED297 TaxID=314283 RepID=A4B939_9GAMM|nr:hypothetical protein [Reinekea blandensis]EAR11140.1 hypothetical protein MED297_19672 [Reinekea sp. MED297] [Reinekea blandensis MED297]